MGEFYLQSVFHEITGISIGSYIERCNLSVVINKISIYLPSCFGNCNSVSSDVVCWKPNI